MCGFAGWVSMDRPLPPDREETIKTMTRLMLHRGPDAEGYWVTSQAALGHRRLVVVDPSGGEQPMIRERNGSNFVLIYNGELYNTADLRKQLTDRGYHFLTRNSDTEALLYSYLEWGTDCTRYLNGIFAFAIWDEGNQRLFMARDRLGVKPLFYHHQSGEMQFGSEIKALLAHPHISRQIGREGLADIMVLGPARSPGRTPFKDISELKPGCQLVFDHQGIKISRYWHLTSHSHEDNPAQTVNRVRELLIDAVRRQLVSDVPLCTLLSGGLDSSAITAIAAAHLDYNLDTYSVDYIDSEQYFQPNGYETNVDRPWV
ncbi:MAG: asparagine synthase (glutamine-hydrolyzing), partial [Methylocystaceae bacterium]